MILKEISLGLDKVEGKCRVRVQKDLLQFLDNDFLANENKGENQLERESDDFYN